MAESPAADAGHVVIGVVGKPVGILGEQYLRIDPDLDIEVPSGTVLTCDDGTARRIEDSRLHGNRRCIRFEGVTDRDGAEALRGTVVSLPRADVPLAEGAIWVADLVGRSVVDPAGVHLGNVSAVTDGHAHEYLEVIRPDGSRRLVPFVAALVEVRDTDVVVDAPPGLLDDDVEVAGRRPEGD